MKKIILVMAVTVLYVTSLFAVDVTIGARGNVNFGWGTTPEGVVKDSLDQCENFTANVISNGGSASTKKGGNIGGGFGFYGNFGLINLGATKLGIQPELDFNFNNGYNYDWHANVGTQTGTISEKCYTHTLDIPVLINIAVPIGKKVEVGFGLGPQISFPLHADGEGVVKVPGVANTSVKYSEVYSDLKGNINFGIAFDANGKYFFGEKNNIGLVLDIRYNLDFTKTQFIETTNNITSKEDVFTRRTLNIGVGCEYRF